MVQPPQTPSEIPHSNLTQTAKPEIKNTRENISAPNYCLGHIKEGNFTLFKPENVREDLWKRLLDKVEEISSRESAEHDICLIGSQARGDASPISDIDLIMFIEGESNLKQTELFYLDETSITIFPVNVNSLIKAESIDFYKANNPFEAKLIHGDGEVLNKARDGVTGKKIDLDATKKIIGETLALRLMGSLGDATLDYGEGIREMRICLAKAKLYNKLLAEKVESWSIIPYIYKPEGNLETMLEELYCSRNYEELSLKIKVLNLKGFMERVFEQQLEVMNQIVEKLVKYLGFAGEYVKNYVTLYLIVEENVRSKIWSMLPGRWRLEEEFRSVNHEASHIACQDREVMWMVSTVEDEKLKLHRYKVTEF